MRKLLVYFIALYTIFSLFSCEKDSMDDCRIVVGGYTEFNTVAERYFFYLTVEYSDTTINESVDQKTYESYYIGDGICF